MGDIIHTDGRFVPSKGLDTEVRTTEKTLNHGKGVCIESTTLSFIVDVTRLLYLLGFKVVEYHFLSKYGTNVMYE